MNPLLNNEQLRDDLFGNHGSVEEILAATIQASARRRQRKIAIRGVVAALVLVILLLPFSGEQRTRAPQIVSIATPALPHRVIHSERFEERIASVPLSLAQLTTTHSFGAGMF